MHTTSPQTSPRAFYIHRIFFLSCLYLRSPESTNIMHSCECIMFQYKTNIFEAGTYLLLSIEFSAYRIEIHLQQTWTFARKSLWNSIYWILLDLRWQWWSRDGSEEGGGRRGTSKVFAAEMKSSRLNKGQTARAGHVSGFAFMRKCIMSCVCHRVQGFFFASV
jgi:hypothetical protein